MTRFIWPDGKRCAVVLSFDVDGEAGILGNSAALASRLSLISQASFGPRVGVPRILELLARHGLRASFFIPGYVAERYPAMVEAVLAGGHEVGHHGYLHEKVAGLTLEQEEAILVKGIEVLRRLTGRAPEGYRAPWWELNPHSPGLLLRHGFRYDSSLMGDDIPYRLETDGGTLLEIPISWLLDDWEQYAYAADPPMGSVIETPAKAIELWTAEFEGMYEYGGCFVLTMHPEWTGRASRLLALGRLIRHIQKFDGVWWTTCAEIAAFCHRHPQP